ncbi:LINE-1 retrotransposable element ORF1 protein [Plecturocebus cupreus]
MLTRTDNLEKNINKLMELKNTIREIREVCTSFNSRIDQVEERILEVEDQLNEMKREDKIREKSVKRNEQNLQEIWDYVKSPNLCFIDIPESDEENESKLENIFQDIIQENFPKLARHYNTQLQAIQRTPQRYSSRRPTPRHIIVRFTRIEPTFCLQSEQHLIPRKECHETRFHYVDQTGLELLTSGNPPTLASRSAGITDQGQNWSLKDKSLAIAEPQIQKINARQERSSYAELMNRRYRPRSAQNQNQVAL